MIKQSTVVAKFLAFTDRMRLVKEHASISRHLLDLEKRYEIDKLSDPAEANEIKAEIKKSQDRLKEILDSLTIER